VFGKGGKDCQRAGVDPTTQAGAGSDQSLTGPEVANPAPWPFGVTFFTALEYPLNIVPAGNHPVMGAEVSDDAVVGVGCFLALDANEVQCWVRDARRNCVASLPTRFLTIQYPGRHMRVHSSRVPLGRLSSQVSKVASDQPTARLPSLTGLGNVPSAIIA